jgi:hypothetical protein
LRIATPGQVALAVPPAVAMLGLGPAEAAALGATLAALDGTGASVGAALADADGAADPPHPASTTASTAVAAMATTR